MIRNSASILVVWIAVALCGSDAQKRPPNYSEDDMPQTSFNCRDKIIGGYYADTQTDCQMFHVCVKIPGVGIQDFRFLCPNDTAFSQESQICDDWYNIDCDANSLYYSDNFDLYRLGSEGAVKKKPANGKATPIPLGPSSTLKPSWLQVQPDFSFIKKPFGVGPAINNAVTDEEDDSFLQRGSDDKKIPADVLRGSSSGNFFSSKNKGREDLEEAAAPSGRDFNKIRDDKKVRKTVVRKIASKRPAAQQNNFYNKHNPTTTTQQKTARISTETATASLFEKINRMTEGNYEKIETIPPPKRNNHDIISKRKKVESTAKPATEFFRLSTVPHAPVKTSANFVKYEIKTAVPTTFLQFQNEPYSGAKLHPEIHQSTSTSPNYYQKSTSAPNYFQQSTSAPNYYQQSTSAPNYYQQSTSAPNYYQQSTSAPNYYHTSSSLAPNYNKHTTSAPAHYHTSSPASAYNQEFQQSQTAKYDPYAVVYRQEPEEEFLKTAQSSSFKASDLNAIYDKQRSKLNATLKAAFVLDTKDNKPVYFSTGAKQVAAASGTASPPKVSKQPIMVANLTTPKKNSDYDYAYYDENPLSEYDSLGSVAEEFSKIKSKQ